MVVYYGNEAEPEYLAGLRNKNVGTDLTFKVTGLQPLTAYYYKVTGHDGNLVSKESNEIGVNTAEGSGNSGIIGVTEAKDGFKVSGRKAYAQGRITVYDLAGRTVSAGTDAVELPSAGCYIIRTQNGTHKVIVK